jgi:hypothetical protein
MAASTAAIGAIARRNIGVEAIITVAWIATAMAARAAAATFIVLAAGVSSVVAAPPGTAKVLPETRVADKMAAVAIMRLFMLSPQ